MITAIIQRATALTGRQPILSNLNPEGNGQKVKIVEVNPFTRGLRSSAVAWQQFQDLAAVLDLDKTTVKDNRSEITGLDEGLDINGIGLKALRLKGIYPCFGGTTVMPYTHGDGVYPLFVALGDGVIENRPRQDHEYAPRGTMTLSAIEREVETALELGPDKTDLVLGFGIFEDLSFFKQSVGFVIYGVQESSDVRLFSQIEKEINRLRKLYPLGSDPTGLLRLPSYGKEMAFESGRKLKYMHVLARKKHGCPHLGNYRSKSEMGLRLLDFEASVSFFNLPRETWLEYLYLDLARMMHEYDRIIGGFLGLSGESMLPLLPHFLWGYFQEQADLPFGQRVKQFIDKEHGVGDIMNTFGSYAQKCNLTPSLIDPFFDIYRLKLHRSAMRVDLKGYAKQMVFGEFYQALEEVAASIA